MSKSKKIMTGHAEKDFQVLKINISVKWIYIYFISTGFYDINEIYYNQC